MPLHTLVTFTIQIHDNVPLCLLYVHDLWKFQRSICYIYLWLIGSYICFSRNVNNNVTRGATIIVNESPLWRSTNARGHCVLRRRNSHEIIKNYHVDNTEETRECVKSTILNKSVLLTRMCIYIRTIVGRLTDSSWSLDRDWQTLLLTYVVSKKIVTKKTLFHKIRSSKLKAEIVVLLRTIF